MRSLWAYIAVLILMVCMLSCTHKDIMCPGTEPYPLTVTFIWDKAPQASPAGMTLYFYPLQSGGKVWRYDIAGAEGGEVELPLGRYALVSVNNDLPGTVYSGQDAFATLAAQPKSNGSTVFPTGMLYRAVVGEIEQTLCGVRYRQPDGTIKECPYELVRCYPDSAATIYNIIVGRVDGLERMRSATARLSGMASELYLGDCKAGADMCATQTSLSLTGQGGLRGTTSGLGSTSEPDFELALIVTRSDGERFSKTFDVTGQVINSRYSHNVTIYIDSLSIPSGTVPPSDEDVGINVDVDGWQVIEINYDENINF